MTSSLNYLPKNYKNYVNISYHHNNKETIGLTLSPRPENVNSRPLPRTYKTFLVIYPCSDNFIYVVIISYFYKLFCLASKKSLNNFN